MYIDLTYDEYAYSQINSKEQYTFWPRYFNSGSLKHIPFNCCLILPVFPFFTLIFSVGTFLEISFSTKGVSKGVNIINAFPPRSKRAVRPTRWIYVSTSS